jgi:acyl-CoA thioesterase
MPALAQTRFERDTAITRHGDDTFTASLDRGWWVMRGPNGGYLAAILLRALEARVADAARAPRSLTIHFVAPPDDGELVVTTHLERTGRSLTSVSARAAQAGRLVALAVAACSASRPGPAFQDLEPPPAPDPASLVSASPLPGAPAFASRWECRWVLGRRRSPGEPVTERAEGGGWIRPVEPQLLDAPAIAAITDAWLPAIFSRVDSDSPGFPVPTIDLTVHFRSALPHAAVAPGDFVLVRFRTNVAADGFLEEDGEVWAADGTLLAQSRQLAAMVAMSG